MATRDHSTAYMRMRSALHARPRTAPLATEFVSESLAAPLRLHASLDPHGSAHENVHENAHGNAHGHGGSAYAALARECEQQLDAIALKQERLAALQAAWERAGVDAAEDDRRAAEVADAASELSRMLAACTSAAERIGRASAAPTLNPSPSPNSCAAPQPAPAHGETSAARAMRANHQAHIVRRIQAAVVRARAAQRRADDHARLVRRAASNDPYARAFTSAAQNAERGDKTADADERGEERDAGFSALQDAALLESTLDVDERVRDVARVAAAVGELATLFQHLNTLIHDQSAMLASIDANIAYARQHAEAGVQQLTQARTHQAAASSRTGYCIALLLVLIAVMACVAVVRRT